MVQLIASVAAPLGHRASDEETSSVLERRVRESVRMVLRTTWEASVQTAALTTD